MNRILILSISLVVAACGGAATQPTTAANSSAHMKTPLAQVTVEELTERLASKPTETFVFDANSSEHFAEGHIPTAKHVAHDGVTAAVLPANKDAFLVFYCWNEQCSASHNAAESAMALGYTNVKVYSGGIEGWRKAGKQIEK